MAWDPARQDWRTFRIDRIAGTLATGAHFVPRPAPEGGDLRAYVSRSLAVNPYSEQARVVLHAPRAAMARRIPPSAGLLEEIDAKRCLLQCGANGLDSLVYWLMALDVDYEVLEPAALNQRLRVASERLARCLAAGEKPRKKNRRMAGPA